MKMFVLVLSAVLMTFALPGQSLFGQSVEPDSRIKNLLDQTSLKYEVDSDGDFKLLYEYDDGRSHIVFVNSKTETYGGMEIREIWSVGYMTPDDGDSVSGKVSENLIRANSRAKLGAWQIQKMDGKEVGVFRAMVPADAGQDIILDTMKLVGITADEKESELLNSDDL